MGQTYSSNPSNPKKESTYKEPAEVKVDYEGVSPRFSVHSAKELQQGVEHLDEHGYAIFSDVLSNDQITKSTDLLWKFLEDLEPPFHIRRIYPQTWDTPWYVLFIYIGECLFTF